MERMKGSVSLENLFAGLERRGCNASKFFFAGMKWHCKEVGESEIFVLWSHLGPQMSAEAAACQMLYTQRADAAGVLARASVVSSSGALKGTAKWKIKTHKKMQKTHNPYKNNS